GESAAARGRRNRSGRRSCVARGCRLRGLLYRPRDSDPDVVAAAVAQGSPPRLARVDRHPGVRAGAEMDERAESRAELRDPREQAAEADRWIAVRALDPPDPQPR